MMLWKCTVCGMIVEGENAPEKCPKCGAPKEKFIRLSNEEEEKIYSSDRTNDIHMEIIELSMRLAKLCEEGISINLDPGCLNTFKKVKEESWTIKQRCKAELATHMSKGKW